ncbi:MAG: MarR family transcriptional regulator [Chloroflexota bacterium]
MSNPDETLPVIAEIMELLSQITDKTEAQNNEVKQWMLQNSSSPAIVEILQNSTLMTLRVLNAVGQLEPANGITISKQFGIPKGSVSKTTRKLLAQKLILTETLPNNKKEVLFRTTPLGKELFEVHRTFDYYMEKGLIKFAQKYTIDELRFIKRLFQDVLDTSVLSLGLDAGRDKTTELIYQSLAEIHISPLKGGLNSE